MKKFKKIIVCFIVIAELMVQFQPISALLKMQVNEQFNMLGTSKRPNENYVDNSKVVEATSKAERILPETSSSSIHLSEYLENNDESNSDKLKGFTQIEKGLFNRSKSKEYKNDANTFSSVLPEILGQETPIRLEYGKTVVHYLPNNFEFKPVSINHNSAFYFTDHRNTYFRYTLGANSFKEEITLLSPQENYIFEYTVSIEKGSIESDNGILYILDNKQSRLFELSAPVIVDSNGNKLTDLTLELVPNKNDYTIKLIIDDTWMNADDRVYPVIIDPVFKDVSNEIDTTISESYPSQTFSNEPFLKVGFDGNGRNRSFLKVNESIITNLLNEASTINHATLSLFAPNDYQIQTQKIQLCSLAENYDFSSSNWENGSNLTSTCYESTPIIEANLKFFNDFFPTLTSNPIDFDISYEVISGTPEKTMDELLLYTLFDNDPTTKISSINGNNEVHQEITINLNKFIRPEEIRLVFGGDEDSSGENLSIEFINTTVENSSLKQLISNGMSPQEGTESQLEEYSKYTTTLSFEPSSMLYNQVKLIIDSTKTNGNPILYDFQITKYQLEEHFIRLNISSYLQKILNNEIGNKGFYLRLEDESQSVIEFSSNNAIDHKPELTIDYTSQLDVSPNYSLDETQLFINPVVNRTDNIYLFDSLTLDGIAKPGSQVTLNLINDEINEKLIFDEQIINITTSFIKPSRNFKSSNIKLTRDRFEGNQLYRVEVQANKDGVSGSKTIETFMIAELGYFRNLSDLAFFYGIDAETIIHDNKIVGTVDKQSKLFIRDPKRNIGVAYTSAADEFITEMQDDDYLLGLNNYSEYFQNKVNINTGNYYLSHTDMTYMMFGEEVNITRTYNSKNKIGLQQFGKSWEFNFNFILIKYADNKLVFKKDDGQKIYFEKNGTSYVTQNNDTHTLKLVDNEYIIEGKDRTYYFNKNNQIEKLTYRNGQEINYSYELDNQRLSIVQLQNKDELEIDYTSTGLINSISYVSVVGLNRTIAQKVYYKYTNEQLKKVIDPIGFELEYEYDTLGRIISWKDRNGNIVDQVTYDEENRVTQIINANDLNVENDLINEFEYYKNKRYTDWIQDGKFIKRVYFNSRFKTELISYANGSKESKIYDSVEGTLKIETLLNGTSLEYSYDDQQNILTIKRGDARTQIFTYDTDNNLLSETDFLGNKTSYEYSDNLKTKIIYADGSTEHFTYENTLLKTHTDQKGYITTYEYDQKGRISKVIFANGETKQTQYNLLGYPTREIDKDLNKRVISRNYRNEVIFETTFEGDITETNYDGKGNIISITDGNGKTRNFAYNVIGLLIKEEDPYQNYTLKTYDKFGNLLNEDKFEKDGITPIVAGAKSSYDDYNRLTKVTFEDSSYEKYQYNLEGELERKIKSTINSEELVTQYRYDRYINKVIQEHLPDGNIITRSYDANGNLSREISSSGILTTYIFNSLNQLINKTDDSGLLTVYSYDLNGNLIKTVESEPQLRTYYTNWSDWTPESSGLFDFETATGYREKLLTFTYQNLNIYKDYEKTGKYKLSETISWLHTNGYGEPWDELESKLIQINDKPALLTSYRDYNYLVYGSCPVSLVGTDNSYKYCKKFFARYIDYEFAGYELIEGEEDFQLQPISENEWNKVETKTLYFQNGLEVESIDSSIYDSELLDYENILKKKFYNSLGYSEWSTSEIVKTENNSVEERYRYREKKIESVQSTSNTLDGYTKTAISEEIDKIAGYQHTNTHGFTWKVGLLGPIVINGKTANLYGYKDFEYQIWGDCDDKIPENGGFYCKKTNYKYVQFTFEALGEFGSFQDEQIIETDRNQVEKIKEYRFEDRNFSEYMSIPTDIYPNESDKKIDQISLRSRSKMIIPNDIVINIGESFDLMSGVAAYDSNGNNITNSISTNIDSIDTSNPGVYEIIYTLESTGLEVIRIIQVQDNSDIIQYSNWTTKTVVNEIQGDINTTKLLETQVYNNYFIPTGEWSAWMDSQPSEQPSNGNMRKIDDSPFYKERAQEIKILHSPTPPDSYYIPVRQLPTTYSNWNQQNIDWDACSPISGEQILSRGGLSMDITKKRTSVLSGFWYYTKYPNEYQYSYYPHTRCGISVRYKYGTQFAGASFAYKIIEWTRTFSENYEFMKYGDWSSDWIPGTKETDSDFERINSIRYRYLDGTLSDWEKAEIDVPDNYVFNEQETRFVYQTRSELSTQKSDILDVGMLVDLSKYYSYIDPVENNLSNLVNIKITLNGNDLSSKINNTSFLFDSVGNYRISYQVGELISDQTILVRGNHSDRVTENGYNEMNQMISSKDALGHITTYQYSNNQLILKIDALGNQEINTFNRNNQLIEKRVVDSNQNLLSKISYIYDGVGNKKSEIDINGYTTIYEFDSNNKLAILKKPVFNEENQIKYSITEYQYDAAGRLIMEIVPPSNENSNGSKDSTDKQLVTTYDSMGRVESIVSRSVGYVNFVESFFEYNINGQPTKLIKQGIQTEYFYNTFGDIIKEKHANGLIIYRDYDRNHKVIKEIKTNKDDRTLIDDTARISETIYNHMGQISSQIDELGRKKIMNYDRFGNVTSTKDFDNQYTKNYYNVMNLVELQIDSRGSHTYQYYNELNYLSLKVDELGNQTSYETNALGYVTKLTNALNEVQKFEVDMYGCVTKQTDALGYVILMEYEPGQKLIKKIYKDLYNNENNLKVETYHYDKLGRLVVEKVKFNDPIDGQSVTLTTSKEYDAFGNIIASIDARNYRTTYAYDRRNQLTLTTYPIQANLPANSSQLKVAQIYDDQTGQLQKTSRYGSVEEYREVTYEYNHFNEKISETYENNSFKTFQYRIDGKLLSESFSNDDTISTEDDYIKTYHYDSNGRLIELIDNAGFDSITQTEFDQTLEVRSYYETGELKTVTNQSGLTIAYEYDLLGRQISQTELDINHETIIDNELISIRIDKVTLYQYDELNRKVQTYYPNGITESIEYDERGNTVKKTTSNSIENRVESYIFNGLNQCIETINALNESTLYRINAIGQTRQTITPNGEATTIKYDSNGNKIKESKENASKTKTITTEWIFDEMNQMTQIKEKRLVEDDLLTTYSYSVLGDLIKVQDPEGFYIEYRYDTMGNKIKDIYQNKNEIDYIYTASNLLKEKKYSDKVSDPLEQFTSKEIYTYTRDGKLKSLTDNPPTSTSEPNLTVYYDYTNGQISQKLSILSEVRNQSEYILDYDRINYEYDNMGQVIQMIDSEGNTTSHRDMNQQLTQVTRIHQDVSKQVNGLEELNRVETGRETVSYNYSDWSNQTKLIYPNGTSVIKEYDALDRLITVKDDTGITNTTYLTDEQKVIETRSNGSAKTSIYELSQIISLRETLVNDDDEEIEIFAQTLEYNEVGNIIREERTHHNVLTVIENEYNSRSELKQSTQVTGNSKITYKYTNNPWGNKSETILREVNGENAPIESKTYTYNHLNQMENVIEGNVETIFSYDARGNLIEERIGSSPIKTYTYDLNNRLIKVEDTIQTQEFTYDGDGNRITKTIKDTSTQVVEHDVQYVNDTSVANEQVIQYRDNTTLHSVVYGNNRINEDGIAYISDAYGNIVQHGSEEYAYTPYGELTQGIIDGVNEAGYKGEVHDSSSLQYLRARTYHTKHQQFISEDTVVGSDTNPLSQNRYTFAMNNPYKYADPSGNLAQAFTEDGKKIVVEPEKKKQTIQDEVADQQADLVLNNRIQAPLYDDLGALERELEQKTKDSINTSDQGFTEDTTRFQNPYNNQSSISAKQSGDVNRFNTSNFWNEPNTKKVLSGLHKLFVGGTVLAISIGAILSGGLTLIPGLMLFGSLIYGGSKAQEGIHETYLGLSGKSEEKSVNLVRDTVFFGNETLYEAFGFISTIGTVISGTPITTILKAAPKIAGTILGALGLRETVYEATGSQELGDLSADIASIAAITYALNNASSTNLINDTIDDIADDVASNIVDDIADDAASNIVDDIADDAASNVIDEAKALEGGSKVIFKSTDDAANLVAKNLDGTLSDLKNGYKIEIPNGNKPIVVRIMNEGSGGRSNPYFRVSVDGKGSLTLDGKLSNDRGLTHIDMTDDYLKQITDMINKYQGK